MMVHTVQPEDLKSNAMRRMRGLLVCLVVVASGLAIPRHVLAADAICPGDVATVGRYRNYSYGFTVVIPKGLEGWWNSPPCSPDPPDGCLCMGDHGRDLPLKGGGFILINADPQVLEESLATAAYKDLQAFEARNDASELVVKVFEPRRFRALPSYRYIATSAKAGAAVVRESVHIMLPSGSYVFVSIDAPELQYQKYRRAYISLLDSLRPSPRN